jgi:DNA-binding XRE family transcriptional regulator
LTGLHENGILCKNFGGDTLRGRKNTKKGAVLKKTRLEKGLTQEAVAVKLEITQGTLSNWELGRSEPSMTALKKLAKIFKVSVAVFF